MLLENLLGGMKMKSTIKMMILFISIFTILFAIPMVSNAGETETATDESTLRSAIENVDDGGTVEIQNNITITGPIVIQKELTIDGNGYTLAGSTDWTSTSGNQSMFTSQFAAGKLTLKDIDLNNGPKYGAQAYDGGTIILENVSITGFRYGGVLVNGGNVEVRNLHLGTNGTGTNNGIEIDKGASATNNPTLTMNGTLTSDSTENVVRPADNGYLTDFTITNTESTTNKVVIAGDKVVLTDENNNVISESAIPEDVNSNTTETAKVIITLVKGEESKQIIVDSGEKVTEELLKSYITVEEGYEIEGFYTDEDYMKKFDFDTDLSSNLTIYVKIEEIPEEEPGESTPDTEIPEEEVKPESKPEKDEVPQTGVESYIGLAVLAIMVSVGVVCLTKKK